MLDSSRLDEQVAAKKAAQEAKLQAAKTQTQLTETQKQVSEAVEATPKIEIDAKGKARVVIPTTKSSSGLSKSAGGTLPKSLPIELR